MTWLSNWNLDRELFSQDPPDPSCPVCGSCQWVEPDNTTTVHTHWCTRCITVFTPGRAPSDWAQKAADIYKESTRPRTAAPPPTTTRPPDRACLSCGEPHAACLDPTPKLRGPGLTPPNELERRRRKERANIRRARELLAERSA